MAVGLGIKGNRTPNASAGAVDAQAHASSKDTPSQSMALATPVSRERADPAKFGIPGCRTIRSCPTSITRPQETYRPGGAPAAETQSETRIVRRFAFARTKFLST